MFIKVADYLFLPKKTRLLMLGRALQKNALKGGASNEKR